MTDIKDYSDIIDLPRPVSKTHPPMSVDARSAQFAPYSAHVGHKDIVAQEENFANTLTDIDQDISVEYNDAIADPYDFPEML